MEKAMHIIWSWLGNIGPLRRLVAPLTAHYLVWARPIAGGTKQAGLTCTVFVDDSAGAAKDISGDITNFGISTPRGVQDITGIDKSAMERLLLLADGQVSLNGIFNASTSDKSHDVFKTVPSTDVARTVTITIGEGGVPTSGDPELAMEMRFADYQITRAADGSITWSATGQLADGTVPTWGTKS